MSTSGLPYFSGNYICNAGKRCDVYSKDKVVEKDPSLISGFFNALMTMAKMSGGELQQVSFENFQYLAQTAPNLVMIMSISIEDNIDDYKNRIQLAIDLFLENFGDNLENWTGNVGVFEVYQSLLDEAEFFAGEPKYRKNCIECQIDKSCSFRMITGLQGLDIKEKMAKYPKKGFIKKWMAFMFEMFRYWNQHNRYRKFQKQYKKIQKEDSSFQLIQMLQAT
jgi:hypothetical protein